MSRIPDVLVLRALGLGDLLTSVPALRGLRRALPGRRLVLAAPSGLGTWFSRMGLVDAVVPVTGLDTPLPPFSPAPEVVVNLHGRGPRSHRLLRSAGAETMLAFACAAAEHDHGPTWRADEHEVDRWLRLVRVLGPVADVEDLRLPHPWPRGEHVVVHPGAASASRRWPVERWAAVVDALVASGRRVVVTGTGAESALTAPLQEHGAEDRAGRDDLPSLARLVGGAALVLSGDTGVAHLATAFGTPSVTLFGPVSPRLWGPRIDRDRHLVLWTGDDAVPRPGDPHGSRCDERLAALDVDPVLDAAATLLDGQAGRATRVSASATAGSAEASSSLSGS